MFLVAAWLCLGLETGLKDVFALRLGTLTIAPGFVFPLAAFVAMCASPQAAAWACLLLGVMVDLTSPRDGADGALLTVVGPNALAYFLAGQFVLTMRGLMIRRNPLTVVFLSVTGAMVAAIVVVAVFTLRKGIVGGVEWSATEQLLTRLGSAVYTGVTALVMSLLLIPLAPLFGFQLGHGRYAVKREFSRR